MRPKYLVTVNVSHKTGNQIVDLILVLQKPPAGVISDGLRSSCITWTFPNHVAAQHCRGIAGGMGFITEVERI